MNEGLEITQSLAVNWMPWLSLALMGLVWLSCVLQPQYMRALVANGFMGVSDNTDDLYPSIGSQIAQWIVNTIVPAMGFLILAEMEVVAGGELFVWILGLTLLADVARLLVALLVQYTFRLGKLMSKAYLCYYSLRSLFTFALLALLLQVVTTSPQTGWLTALGVVSAVYMVILCWQWGRLFGTTLAGVIGLALYVLTVELLPAVLIWQIAGQLYFLHFA